jgi:hypothetical protein
MSRIRELERAIREAESLGRDALALRLRYELARLTAPALAA